MASLCYNILFRKVLAEKLSAKRCMLPLFARWYSSLGCAPVCRTVPPTALNLLGRSQIQDEDRSAKIDPISGIKYEAPSLNNFFKINTILGEPVMIKPEMVEPNRIPLRPIIDPNSDKPGIQAHKHDKYWRRRGMKHHRYMRWRKRNETLLQYLDEQKAKKRDLARKQELESIWKSAGLEKEPPELSESQKASLIQSWKEEGIWTEPLTPQELYSYADPALPKNRKTMTLKNPYE